MIADRMSRIDPSETLKVADKVKEMERKGKDIIHFDLGEPDFPTPEIIRKAAKEAMDKGLTHYTSSAGMKELRDAISEDLGNFGVDFSSDEIIVTPGAKQAILYGLFATVNSGDEVIIFDPSWPTHASIVKIAEGVPVRIKTNENLEPDIDFLKKNITKKTRMILVNSPNNPTGAVYEKKTLEQIAEIANENNLLVMSDEIYKEMVYDRKHTSFASLNGMKERTIHIDGFSKTFAMTGWRLGYIAAKAPIIKNVLKLQQNSATCPAAFVQAAGIVALKEARQETKKMIKEYKQRRNLILKGLMKIGRIKIPIPHGAFYVFPDFSFTKLSSDELQSRLLEEKGVSTIPGNAFGKEYDGFLRISYATSKERILEGLSRLKEFVNNL